MTLLLRLSAWFCGLPWWVSSMERGDFTAGLHGVGAHVCGVPGQFYDPANLESCFDEINRSVGTRKSLLQFE